MKKLVALLLCGICAGVCSAATTEKTPAAAKAKVEFVIVESSDYPAGKEDPQLTAGIAQFLGVTPVVKRVSEAQAATDKRLAGIKYDFLPLYLVQKTKAVRSKMEKPLQHGYAQENEDFIILSHQTRQGVYADKPVQKGVLDLFVMAQCPFGVRAENLVIQAKKEGKVPADKTLRLRYIVDYDPVRGFNSMHGSGEWEEAVRQLLIAKYYPQKFWKYLEIRNKDYRSSRWDKAMEQAGISVSKITKKFDSEGLELLKEQAAYAKEFGISASPTVLWEGKVQMDLRGAMQLEGFGFFEGFFKPDHASGAVVAGSC
ncbi:MAG: hypothetical protein MJ053_01415 [Elusimicrobiaceae bacterium]|nr:hypothetical protein [Elusimicrobiaceae bacterium]